MSFIDELKHAHENEKKRLEEERAVAHQKVLEECSTEVHEVIRKDSMSKAKTGRTHAEGYVATNRYDFGLRSYEKPPVVGRRDSEDNFTWNDGGECSAITPNGEFCDKVIVMVSDSLRKDGFVNFTLSRCPCYQKKKVRRKHFLSPDTTELIDTNNFLGYIIQYSVSW